MDRNCDICGKPAIVDSKTTHGPWSYLCSNCFNAIGYKSAGLHTTLKCIGCDKRKTCNKQAVASVAAKAGCI